MTLMTVIYHQFNFGQLLNDLNIVVVLNNH